MISWFVPREVKFFKMFDSSAQIIFEGAKELLNLTQNLNQVEPLVKKIKDYEIAADKISHSTIQELHATFITPLDRDGMFQLISKMDDIMDYIDAVAQRFLLFNIQTVTPEIEQLSKIILSSTQKVGEAVRGLENMKNSKTTLELCHEVYKFEGEADHIMRVGMSKLFRDDIQFKDLIKLKEVLELLESVTDRCKEVANIVEGIVLDHA